MGIFESKTPVFATIDNLPRFAIVDGMKICSILNETESNYYMNGEFTKFWIPKDRACILDNEYLIRLNTLGASKAEDYAIELWKSVKGGAKT